MRSSRLHFHVLYGYKPHLVFLSLLCYERKLDIAFLQFFLLIEFVVFVPRQFNVQGIPQLLCDVPDGKL